MIKDVFGQGALIFFERVRTLDNRKKTIYIFGHKNPDTDSTCAAITYAYLKNQIDSDNEYVPAVLGDINNETSFVLDYFGLIQSVFLVQCLQCCLRWRFFSKERSTGNHKH